MNEGKKDRRDPIRTIKPRNFVAKNAGATTSGAGAHKDKKKAMKQGDVKHKKQEYAESLESRLSTRLDELSKGTLSNYSDKADMDIVKAHRVRGPQSQAGDKKAVAKTDKRIDKRMAGIDKAVKRITKESAGEPEGDTVKNSLHTIIRVATHMERAIDTNEDFPEWVSEKIGAIKELMVGVMDYTISSQEQDDGDRLDHSPVAEDGEGTPEGLPDLTVELAKHIRDQIETEGPHAICKSVEWGDGAADDLVRLIQNALDDFIEADTNEGYRDYDDNRSGFRRREREDDEYHVPDPEVKEATRTYAPPKTNLKVGDRVVADLRKEKNYPTDQQYVSGFVTRIGEKGVHIDPDGGGEPEWHPYKIVKKLGEGWTHDSLAARLFETENTYEQQLAGKLARALKK